MIDAGLKPRENAPMVATKNPMIKIKNKKKIARILLVFVFAMLMIGFVFMPGAYLPAGSFSETPLVFNFMAAFLPTPHPSPAPGMVEFPPAPTPTPVLWSCEGKMGTTKPSDHKYFLTSFGCWMDSKGVRHQDGSDNCKPSGLWHVKEAGLCDWSMTGPQCEQFLNYYTADGSRFPYLTRLKITNPENGKSVVAVVIETGPSCWVERNVGGAVIDVSVPVSLYLFGDSRGWREKAIVIVVEVDPSTPLGPVR